MAFKKPVWIEQGPGPFAMPVGTYDKAAGAIQAIVVDPVDPDRVFVASVGGGIWMSRDAISAADPTWVPQSDYLPSLTMSALAMSPLDPNRNTLYAGCGRTTNAHPLVGPGGGPLFGLLKTVDGGAKWNEIARTEFQGKFVARILPLAVRTNEGDRVLVATLEGGLHISPDGGATWALSTAVAAPVTDVAAEPTNASVVYVVSAHRIWRSDDAGDTDWHDISPAEWVNLPAWWTIRLTVSPGTDFDGNHWIYAGATDGIHNGGVLVSTNRGVTWSQVGVPLDDRTPMEIHNPGPPMAVSPVLPDVLFVATDAGSPNHYMGIVSPGDATQWTSIENDGANGTGPHTDARDCAFVLDGSLMFETNDGGISRLSNPYSQQRKWTQAVGNLRIAEFHSIAYDSVNHIVFGATQDNGVPQQTSQNATNWEMNEDPWGDASCAGADVSSTPGAAIHYSSQQSLFHFVRRTYTGPTQSTASQGLGLVIAGSGGLQYNQVEGGIREDGGLGTVRWNQNWVLNAADPTRILLGTNFLYESFDRGDTFTALGGLTKNMNGNWMPDNAVGRVSAYAYGHSQNADVIYVGANGILLLRTGQSGLPQAVPTYPGGRPVGITLDSGDWRRAYVLDTTGRVFRTIDAGATVNGWAELTGDLPQFTGDVRSIVAVPRASVNGAEVIFVAGYGGVYVVENAGNGRYPMWRKHGANFPNAVVTEIHYSAADDVLIAGTLGRAAWALSNASATLLGEPTVSVVSNQKGSCVLGWVEGSTVIFTAKIQGGAALANPLSYQWTVAGAVAQPPATNAQVTATMPAAGTEVVIMVRVTDATGYQLVRSISGMSTTVQVAILRSKLCALLGKIKQEEIFNPYVNPLGPDVGPDDDGVRNPFGPLGPRIAPTAIAGLPDYARLHRLMSSFTQVLRDLAEQDRLKTSQHTLYQMSEGAVRRWAALENATARVKANLGRSDGFPGGRVESLDHGSSSEKA